MAVEVSLGPRFFRLWTGAAISNLGDGLVLVAMPLLVESLTKNAIYISGLITMRYAAWLLLGLVGGAVADRADRQRVMVYVDLARTAVVAVLGIVIVLGRPPVALVWLTAFLLGCGEAFFDSASEAMLPAVVEHERDLEPANGRLFATQTIANELVGPPIGALLFATAAALPFLLDAWSFLAAAMIVLTLRGSFRPHIQRESASSDASLDNKTPDHKTPDDTSPEDNARAAEQHASVERNRSPEAAESAESVGTGIREGFRFVRTQPLLQSLIALGCAWNFFAIGSEATLVVFARRELHVSAKGYGLVLTGFAIGGVLAAWRTERIIERFGAGTTILATFLLGAAAGFTTAATSNVVVFAIGFSLSYAAGTAASIAVVSLRQQLVPDHFRGRVSSFFRVSVFGSAGVGALVMGVVADRISYRAPLLALGAAGVVLFLVALTTVNNRTISAALRPTTSS